MNKVLLSKNAVVIILLGYLILFSTCTEPELFEYEVFVENNTSNNITVNMYRFSYNDPSLTTIIASGTTEKICDYLHESFVSYACELGRIEFVFDNGLGYCCIQGRGAINTSEVCFLNEKNPFRPDRLPDNGNGTIFTVTQEDFDNAYELP